MPTETIVADARDAAELAESPDYPPSLPRPEEMPGWFERLGLRARQGAFVDLFGGRVSGCCALGAVYLHRTHWLRDGDAGSLQGLFDDSARRVILHVTDDEDKGAVMGFDGERAAPPPNASPEFRAGFAWGRDVWRECVAAGVAAVTRS